MSRTVIETSFFSVKSAIDELIELCDQLKPEIIHAFDKFAAYFARRASVSCNIPWLLTKCGGPNPSKRKRFLSPAFYYPCAKIQTVFHQDDYNWFTKRIFKPARTELISARVLFNLAFAHFFVPFELTGIISLDKLKR